MPEQERQFDAVVIGAGFAGLYMLHKLRELGYRSHVFEAGSGVGGTWFWNRYPGARCDVESMSYSYSFSSELEQEWEWSERYPAQPEILRYLNHVADRFDLRRDIELNTRVTSATFDDETLEWTVRTDKGEELRCQYLILGVGNLSAAAVQVPDFPGIETFSGQWHHTCDWPVDGVDFSGKRVGVIGTGSSGIQAIPVIAEQAAHLTVFQRTAAFSLPARNRPLEDEVQRELKARYPEHRQMLRTHNFFFSNPENAVGTPVEQIRQRLEERWEAGGPVLLTSYGDILLDEWANEQAAEFVREKIRQTVRDPEVAELLCPKNTPIGAKRICLDTNYFETYNRDNVTLVDVRSAPIQEITEYGIRTANAEYELDVIVFATGFDAMTGAILAIDIKGRDGLSLRDKWADGPRTYLGVATADFPNLFIITGPGSPSVISNMVVSIEQHVDWIADLMEHMRMLGLKSVEPEVDVEDRWVQHVVEVADTTLIPKADTWYAGANIPGKPRVFMPFVGGVGTYRQICNDVAAKDYEGFSFRP